MLTGLHMVYTQHLAMAVQLNGKKRKTPKKVTHVIIFFQSSKVIRHLCMRKKNSKCK